MRWQSDVVLLHQRAKALRILFRSVTSLGCTLNSATVGVARDNLSLLVWLLRSQAA